MRGVTSLVPAERKSPLNLWRWPPRKIAGRGGALIVLEEKHGPIREVTACWEAGAGVSGSWRWQTRERPALEEAQYVQLKDAQPDGHAWALASPQPRTCMGLKLTSAILAWQTQRLPGVCSCTDRRRWGPGAPGLAGAAAPPLRSPRFRPRPGGGRDCGRAAPSACAWELPPPARAPVRRPHRLQEWRAPGPRVSATRRRSSQSGTLGGVGWSRVSLPPGMGHSAPAASREPGLGGAKAGDCFQGELGGRTEPVETPSSPRLAATPEGPTPSADGRDPGGDQLDPGSPAPLSDWRQQY